MKPSNNAAIRAISVNAIPQEKRPDVSEFDIGCWTFGVERLLQRRSKKVPPPTPEGREGRLFPPEHSWKTGFVVTELTDDGNKILYRPQVQRRIVSCANGQRAF